MTPFRAPSRRRVSGFVLAILLLLGALPAHGDHGDHGDHGIHGVSVVATLPGHEPTSPEVQEAQQDAHTHGHGHRHAHDHDHDHDHDHSGDPGEAPPCPRGPCPAGSPACAVTPVPPAPSMPIAGLVLSVPAGIQVDLNPPSALGPSLFRPPRGATVTLQAPVSGPTPTPPPKAVV